MAEEMEQWELDRRKHLWDTMPFGAYRFSSPNGMNTYTGKMGAIDIHIAIEKEGRKLVTAGKSVQEMIQMHPDLVHKYSELTEKELTDILSEFFKKK